MQTLIKALEDSLKKRVILIATATRSDIAFDLDENAARLLRSLRDTQHSYIVLLFGGGGHLGFADSATRILGDFEVLIPERITSSLALLALSASHRFMTQHAAIGAYDHGPFWKPPPEISAYFYDDIPALGGLNTEHDPTMPARVAFLKNISRRSKIWLEANTDTFDYARLSTFEIGLDTGLSATQISKLNLPTTMLDNEDLRKLSDHLDQELGNGVSPLQRYTETDLADEVEFEFAIEIPAAILATSQLQFSYMIDTGNPDPDTGKFIGGWEKTVY